MNLCGKGGKACYRDLLESAGREDGTFEVLETESIRVVVLKEEVVQQLHGLWVA